MWIQHDILQSVACNQTTHFSHSLKPGLSLSQLPSERTAHGTGRHSICPPPTTPSWLKSTNSHTNLVDNSACQLSRSEASFSVDHINSRSAWQPGLYQAESGYQSGNGGWSASSRSSSQSLSPPDSWQPCPSPECRREVCFSDDNWAACSAWNLSETSIDKKLSGCVDGLNVSINGKVNFQLTSPRVASLLLDYLHEEKSRLAEQWSCKLNWETFFKYQAIEKTIDSLEIQFMIAFNEHISRQSQSPAHQAGQSQDFVLSTETLMQTISTVFSSAEDDLSAEPEIPALIDDDFTHRNSVWAPVDLDSVDSDRIPVHLGPAMCADLPLSTKAHLNGSNSNIGGKNCVLKSDSMSNIRYKTSECTHFKKGLPCPAGEDCHFAHGINELRRPIQHPKYKTQICHHFSKYGTCPFGEQCYFKH